MTDNFKLFGSFTIGNIIAIFAIIIPLAVSTIKTLRKNKLLSALLSEPYGFWSYLLEYLPRGTAMEALKYDIVSQRKHVKSILEDLEALERIIGCGDPELGLTARNSEPGEMSEVRGIIISLDARHRRNSSWYDKGPWKEYFKKRKSIQP